MACPHPGRQARSAEGVMVRRLSVASLDSGAESPVYGEEPSASADRNPRAKAPWAGGGGRWAVWPMRVVLWAAILIIGYRGVTAILFNETPSSGGATGNDATGATASGFPVALGELSRCSSGRSTSITVRAPRRSGPAARGLYPGECPGEGPTIRLEWQWDLCLQSTEVAGVDVRSSDTAVVTLMSTVNGQLMELGVPLYAANGGLVVSGQPPGFPRRRRPRCPARRRRLPTRPRRASWRANCRASSRRSQAATRLRSAGTWNREPR